MALTTHETIASAASREHGKSIAGDTAGLAKQAVSESGGERPAVTYGGYQQRCAVKATWGSFPQSASCRPRLLTRTSFRGRGESMRGNVTKSVVE